MACRSMVFTINNYTDENIQAIQDLTQHIRISCGYEVGAEGTPHIQGVVVWKQPKQFKAAQKLLLGTNEGCYTAKMVKCWQANINYTQKSANLLRFEDNAAQGNRTDLEGIGELVKEGKRMRDIAAENPSVYIKYSRGMHALQAILIKPRTEMPRITVLWGKTGTGKSKEAREWLPNEPYVWSPAQGQWFDGYEGEKEVIFEEYRGNFPMGMLLLLLDRYECRVQYKGGAMQFAGTNICITSPMHPKDWYCNQESDKIDQLLRRITIIKELK